MPKHTPGPWEEQGGRVYGQSIMGPGDRTVSDDGKILMEDRFCLAETFRKGAYPSAADWDEVRANARLIAAAPSLLGALKHALVLIEAFVPADYADRTRAVTMYQAAIDKAEDK